MEAPCAGGKKGRILSQEVFISALTWKWGENPCDSLSLVAFGPGGGSGWTHAYSCALVLILRSPVHAAGNFHSDLTKDLQLKWISGFRGDGWELGKEVSLNQAVWFLKA
jgi:hypothetical protein